MKLKLIIIFALVAASAFSTLSAQSFLGIDGEESTSIGVYIKDIRSGEVLVDHNSQLALTPASVMKAVTTATVLSVNGETKRFATPVVLRGRKGTQSGVWQGDLVIKGVADPTLESENFKSRLGFCDSIISNLRRKGIKSIQGTIIVEENLKNAGPILQWELEDVAWPYGAGLFGFNYRDNSFTIWPATKRTKPEVPGLDVTVRKVATGNDFIRGVYSDHLVIDARDPSKKDWAVKTTMPDPAKVFVAELKTKLAAAGIQVVDKKNAAPADKEDMKLYTHRSATYGEIMRSLMVRSDNLFAEGMLRTLAPTDSRKAAISREKDLWATRGINTRYTIINDGSGLTRANRLSSHFLGDILEWMAKSDKAEAYTSYFPRAGKDGTMRGFLAKSPLKGLIALKTGSVSSVQCYAGYKLDEEGTPTHVIVVMVNGFFCPRSQVREATEDLLTNLFID